MRQVCWRVREVPMAPLAVVARGSIARDLGHRVLDAGTERWTGCVGDRLLIVAGEHLPWVDGVVFLGGVSGSPLWFDTRLEPDVPVPLVERAVARRLAGRVAWLHDPHALVPLGALDVLDPTRLEAWLHS